MNQTAPGPNRAERRAAKYKRPRIDRNNVNPNIVLSPTQLSRDFNDEESARLGNEVRMCWYRLTNGMGKVYDFDMLCNAMNVAIVRASGIENGKSAVQMVKNAMNSLADMRDRFERTDRFGPDALALQTLPPALDFYDDLLRLSTPLQMTEALRDSMKLMDRGVIFRPRKRT